MNKTLLRARLEEVLDNFEFLDWEQDDKDELVDQLIVEVTKLDMETLFDTEEPEESDELEP